jgi:hypothetical protein
MTMHSPIIAMLWENVCLTRAEAAWRLSFGLVAGSGVLAFFAAIANERLRNAGAAVAVGLLLTQHMPMWLSIAKLNGGRFLDGYKPGFPLHLLYTRPVRTVVIVGVSMVYDAVSCAALYLVSAAVLGLVFGQTLPLLPVAVWIAAFHLAQFVSQYSTRNRVVQWLGGGVIGSLFFVWLMYRADFSSQSVEFRDVRFVAWLLFRADWSPLRVEFPLADYALMASIGLVSFGLAVAGVARQRLGDTPAAISRTVGTATFSERLVGLFRFPCPTSSATRAHVWFELRSSGLPVLTIGAALAIVTPLLFVVTGRIDALLSGFYVRPIAVSVAVFSLPIVLILAGKWIVAAAMVLATVYLSWSVLSERLLTLRQACGAIVVSAAFGVAWVTLLRAAGMSLGGMPTTDAVWMLSPALLPPLVSVLAPWSLSRIRHT